MLSEATAPAYPYAVAQPGASPWITDPTPAAVVAAAATEAGASWATPADNRSVGATVSLPPWVLPSSVAHQIPFHSHEPPGPSAVVVTAPPPELPQWAAMEPFSLTNTNALEHSRLHPLFQDAAGSEPAPSTLGPVQLVAIEQHYHAETTLEQWYTSGVAPRSNLVTQSSLDRQHGSFIDQFWQVQQHNCAMLDRSRNKGSGKGASNPFAAGAPGPPQDADGVVDFDGDDSTCSICLSDFEGGQWCLRLVCRHLFHVECFNDVLIRSGIGTTDRCPNCRGSARIAARFRFIAAPVAQSMATPAESRATAADSFRSVMTAFPWYHAAGQQLMVTTTLLHTCQAGAWAS